MEFSAIILAAGKGCRMVDLTSHCPKAILPVGNYPMIWYPLHFLEQAGLEEVHVIVNESAKSKIEDSVSKCELKIRPVYVVIPANEDWGTADALRHVVNSRAFSPKRDVMIVSCDLVTDFALHRLLDVHRKNNSSLTALFAPIPPEFMGLPVPGQKSKAKLERDFVGIEPNTSRLLFMSSEADFDDTLYIRRSLLQKHSQIVMRSNLLDGHLYIMKRWIIDYIIHETSISAIKGELISLIVAKQFVNEQSELPPTNASVIGVTNKKDIAQFAKLDPLADLVNQLSSTMEVNDYYQLRKMKPSPISCYAYIADGAFCMRANSLATYCELNRQIVKRLSLSLPGVERSIIMRPAATAKSKIQVGSDSLVGSGTTVGDKSSIKRSIIGHNCEIGEKVKIANCIILDNVKLLDGCNIQGSLVCSNATLGELSELKDCLVTAGQEVHSAAKLGNEVVSNLGHLMEVHM